MKIQNRSIIYLAPRGSGKTTWLIEQIIDYIKDGGSVDNIVVKLFNYAEEKLWKSMYAEMWVKKIIGPPKYPPIRCSSNLALNYIYANANVETLYWDEPLPNDDDRELFKIARQRAIQQIMTWTPLARNSFIDYPPDDFKIIKVHK